MPVLANVLLEGKRPNINLTGSDFRGRVNGHVPLMSARGVLRVPLGKLMDILIKSYLTGAVIEFTLDEQKAGSLLAVHALVWLRYQRMNFQIFKTCKGDLGRFLFLNSVRRL